MATRIRLQRHGRKSRPIFKIVIADSRSKRDGKYIENIGQYNPNTNPATIDLDFDRALDWVMKGAQPSNTALALLKYKGVMMKKHLLGGVVKGAFSEEEAESKFEAWLAEKEEKINSKKDLLYKDKQEENKKRLAAEKEINDKRAQELAVANSELAQEIEASSDVDVTTEEGASAETTEEVTEATSEEKAVVAAEEIVETPSEDATPEAAETPNEEAAEAISTTEEAVQEKPADEVPIEAVSEETDEATDEEVSKDAPEATEKESDEK